MATLVLLAVLEAWRRWPAVLIVLIPLALAFGFGMVPGFQRLAVGAYSLNTGKALLGILLMLYLPWRFAWPWRDRQFLLGAIGIPSLTLGLAFALDFLHWQPLALAALLGFAFSNFFSTVAEEAFFRGLVQAPLQQRLSRWPCLLGVALLFGAVHLAGGWLFAAFAALAGLGYALTYERSQSIWAAVLVHLGLNVLRVAIGG
ncbi:MAG TPA: type II CAAX endopeptidase family protein [Permianibacter sp.]|nr:type II CAAX endopeptidase family protein [Permianibacter sp.]